MKTIFPLYQVDAFTQEPFKGNPAGVCYLMAPQPTRWMQKVATEMNLSETAFFLIREPAIELRWFTPATEVDLCGHATLAAAHIIWETDLLPTTHAIRFETRSGFLKAHKRGDWIELDFPAESPEAILLPAGMAEALGTDPLSCFKTSMDVLVELGSEAEVLALKPDFKLLAKLGERGVIVTAPAANGQYDFVSRFFAPAVGIDEDPVTGSAHCALGPFWKERLGKKELIGYQASHRGGIVKVQVKGKRALLTGRCATVFQGVITAQ